MIDFETQKELLREIISPQKALKKAVPMELLINNQQQTIQTWRNKIPLVILMLILDKEIAAKPSYKVDSTPNATQMASKTTNHLKIVVIVVKHGSTHTEKTFCDNVPQT